MTGPLVVGAPLHLAKARIWARIAALAFRHGGSPAAAARALGDFLRERARDRAGRATLKYNGRLARAWGAGFVQLLEPKAVGRWQAVDVALDVLQRQALEAFSSGGRRSRCGRGR